MCYKERQMQFWLTAYVLLASQALEDHDFDAMPQCLHSASSMCLTLQESSSNACSVFELPLTLPLLYSNPCALPHCKTAWPHIAKLLQRCHNGHINLRMTRRAIAGSLVELVEKAMYVMHHSQPQVEPAVGCSKQMLAVYTILFTA